MLLAFTVQIQFDLSIFKSPLPSFMIWVFYILDGQFYRVHVGVQLPEGVTTTRGVLRRFNDFLKLFTDVSLFFSPLHFS